MKQTPAILSLALALASCAPVVTSATPTQITMSASYTTGTLRAGEDSPVLAAIVAIAPTAPVTDSNRQPWRAEDIERNLVVLRSQPRTTTTAFSLSNFAQEMSWNVISSAGVTTVTARYSSAYAAAADHIFAKLDARFSRVK
ncbi:hypothetical protein [Deinococcus marmoris]|uniref:hypothetical protein n=1 Tax=Deinococcus marmoris TaxID=249408 RepID=UPI0012DF1519|nr:hypothetical protein [Deinococcus marmoris]